jgi:hypothetical protein
MIAMSSMVVREQGRISLVFGSCEQVNSVSGEQCAVEDDKGERPTPPKKLGMGRLG